MVNIPSIPIVKYIPVVWLAVVGDFIIAIVLVFLGIEESSGFSKVNGESLGLVFFSRVRISAVRRSPAALSGLSNSELELLSAISIGLAGLIGLGIGLDCCYCCSRYCLALASRLALSLERRFLSTSRAIRRASILILALASILV